MNIYADHNFLIYCAKNAAWRKSVIDAHQGGRITVVLSAWHFYEYGNANGRADTEDLINFAEELQPKWILERGDLQIREFSAEWNNLWSGEPFEFNPICSLAEAGASLNRVPVERMSRYSIRDYVASYSAPGALDVIRAELEKQKAVAKYNLEKYVSDKRFDEVIPLTRLFYVAVQLARSKEIVPDRVYALANQMMREQPIATQIKCFVDWKGLELLKAYMVEVALTLDLYPSKATLDVNRQIDRQHAIVALPYCDILVTDDGDLTKRCKRVKQKLRFKTADVITGKELIDSL